mmetsp:Transcript_34723/g.79212  ORF Transcript_34723/g.79212 Transcript_34723/m.79212 type:complete len:91 (+) Transcript_34723:608-880(+)
MLVEPFLFHVHHFHSSFRIPIWPMEMSSKILYVFNSKISIEKSTKSLVLILLLDRNWRRSRHGFGDGGMNERPFFQATAIQRPMIFQKVT